MALLYLVLALSSGSLPERARRRDVCSQSEARARGQWLLLRGGEGDWQASLREAMQSQQEGKLEAAAQAYREAMSLHEPLRSAWPVLTNYGLSIQPSSPAEAAKAFRSAISLIPDGARQADGYFNLGNALIDVGDVDGYVAAFESCIALAPHDADAHYNLGSALLSSRHPQRALPALHAAASLSPSDGKAHLGLGDCLMRLNRVLEAEASYARARQLRPDHAPTLASSGNCAEERGAMREAEELWKKSLAIAPDDAVRSSHCLLSSNGPRPAPAFRFSSAPPPTGGAYLARTRSQKREKNQVFRGQPPGLRELYRGFAFPALVIYAGRQALHCARVYRCQQRPLPQRLPSPGWLRRQPTPSPIFQSRPHPPFGPPAQPCSSAQPAVIRVRSILIWERCCAGRTGCPNLALPTPPP